MNVEKNLPFHRLRRLSVVSGFLDGLDIEFAPGLNCIIGGRGTGKTTILEFIRYALDLKHGEPAWRKNVQSLVEHNLAGGRIRLTIETKEGLTYIVSRTAGEEPRVLDSKGNSTDITLSSGVLFATDVYGQNQIEGIADDRLPQLELIDNFEVDVIREDNLQIQRVSSKLRSNAQECIQVQKVTAGIADELGTLQSLEDRLKEFKMTTGHDAHVVNQAHEQKAQRDRERRAIAAAQGLLEDYAREIDGLVGRLPQGIGQIFDRETVAGPNVEATRSLQAILLKCGKEVDGVLEAARTRARDVAASFSAEASKLTATHKSQDAAFEDLIEKHKEAMGQSAERASLERRRNVLLDKKRAFDQKNKELQKLLQERATLLVELSELRNHRFGIRRRVAERINAEVLPQIRVRVEQYGNTQNYRELLESNLRNAAIRHGIVAGKIAGRISPTDFAEVIRQKDHNALVERAEINADQALKVVDALYGNPALYEFEAVELIDLPCIELEDGGEYKNSLTLSTGQKCTSILPILLLDSEKPLLVDQPEDNLDNRFVFTTVVKRIREVKRKRQLIFITHNPNIPVLSDADKVFVLTSTGKNGTVQKSGSVDECKQHIVTLLEGGEEAFKERKRRYDY